MPASVLNKDKYICGMSGCMYLAKDLSNLDLAYHRFYFHEEYGNISKFKLLASLIESGDDRVLAKRIKYRNSVIDYLERFCTIDQLKNAKEEYIKVHVDPIGHVIEQTDENEYRSICGGHLKNKMGSVCTKSAGWGTSHFRTGKCKFHDRNSDEHRATFLSEFIGDDGHTLSGSLAKADALEEGELHDQLVILETLYGLLHSALKENVIRVQVPEGSVAGDLIEIPNTLDATKSHKILGIVGEIRKTQETRAKILNMLILNSKDIRRFMDDLFAVVHRYIPSDRIGDMNRDIRDNVSMRVGNTSMPLHNMKQIDVTPEDRETVDITPYDRFEDIEDVKVEPSPEETVVVPKLAKPKGTPNYGGGSAPKSGRKW